MGCLLPLAALLVPRFTMLCIFIVTDWFAQAFETKLWPILGFLFMPFTTLAWMAAMLNNGHKLDGWWLVLLIVAVFFDLGSSSTGSSSGSHK